jgi:hypothetical protein
MFCRLKDWRRIATRFDRNIKNFFAAVALAASLLAREFGISSGVFYSRLTSRAPSR